MPFAAVVRGAFIAFVFLSSVAGVNAGGIAAELKEWQTTKATVQKLWFARDFSALDELAEHWRSARVRTTSGNWKLAAFYEVFDDFRKASLPLDFPAGADWATIDEWLEASPASPTPIIIKSLMLMQQGCKVRSMSQSDPPNPLSPVPDFFGLSRELLERHGELSLREPHWHTAKLRLLILEGATDDDLLIEHARALELHPTYYQTHLELFSYFATRWGPNLSLIDAFANTVLLHTKELEGYMIYARLYTNAIAKFGNGNFYSISPAVWAKVKAGYSEISYRYPTAWNLHHYAFFACAAHDVEAARRLFEAFGTEVVKEAWQSSIYYEQCKQWALK